jgi:hypothetical protein
MGPTEPQSKEPQSKAARTFAALERVHRGKVHLEDRPHLSAALLARVLQTLIRKANPNGEIPDQFALTVDDIAGAYIGQETARKALYALKSQGVITMRQARHRFTITIAPFVYDTSLARPAPVNSPPKAKRPRSSQLEPDPGSQPRARRTRPRAPREASPECTPHTSPECTPHTSPECTPHTSSHYRSTSGDPEGRHLGRGDGSGGEPDALASPDPRVGEVIAAIDAFYAEGSAVRGNHDQLVSVLGQASPETIANVPMWKKRTIQAAIWERTAFPRCLWTVEASPGPSQ